MASRSSRNLANNNILMYRRRRSGSAQSLASALLVAEAQGMAIDFTDDFFRVSDGHYGSMRVKDTGTPANDFDGIPFTKITNTAPSLKMLENADGNLAFQAHNLAPRSETPANAEWAATATTKTSTSEIGPQGAVSLLATLTANTNNFVFGNTGSAAAGIPFAFSISLKRGTANFMSVELWRGTGTLGTNASAWVSLDLAAGTISSVRVDSGTTYFTGASASVVADEDYWRVTVSATTTAAATTIYWGVRVTDNGAAFPTFTAVNGLTYYASKPHLRRTPSDDTYIPTTTTARYALPIEHSGGVPVGVRVEEARTNNVLHNRDLTNAAWVKTNATAAKTATGTDGIANSASTLTATAANGAVIQNLTLASAARSGSVYLKRRTGTGAVTFAYGETTGSELVTNGTFASDVAGWSPFSGGSIAHNGAGAATVTGAGASSTGAYSPITVTAGKLYRFEYTMTLGTATLMDVTVNANATGGGASLGNTYSLQSSNGTYVKYFYATASTHSVAFFPRGVGNTVTIDNVSVLEVAESTIDLSGGGWVRAKIENKTITNPVIAVKCATSGDAVDVDLGQDDIGAFVTSPIPTLAAAVLRAADNMSVLTSAFPLSATAGTFYGKASVPNLLSLATIASIGNAVSTNDRFILRGDLSNPKFIVIIGGTAEANIDAGTITAASDFKLAGAYAANDAAASFNGGAVVTDVSVTLPTVTVLYVGRASGPTPGEHLNGLIKQIIYLPRRMSNAELIALTA